VKQEAFLKLIAKRDKIICREYRQGMSLERIAAEWKMGRANVMRILREHSAEYQRVYPTQKRNQEIYRLWRGGGLTLQEIGDRYGITRERVRQIAFRERRQRSRAVISPLLSVDHPRRGNDTT